MNSRTRPFLLPGAALIGLLSSPAMPQTIEPKIPPSLPGPQMLPDLVVSRIEFVDGVFIGPCSRVGVTISNVGRAGIGAPVMVRLTTAIPATEATPTSIDRQFTAGLAAGASGTVFFDPFDLAVDPRRVQVFISAEADPANEIIELNQSNNRRDVEQSVLAARSDCPFVSVSGGSASEGSPVGFILRMSRPFPRDVSVSYATANGTAVAGPCTGIGDYVSSDGHITFAARTTSLTRTVAVPTCTDGREESSESFTLRLSGPVNATIRPSQATGTIQNRPAT